MRAGKGPRSAALDIVGRINKATGRRDGGVIGLAENQIRARDTAMSELRSGNRRLMENYLTRKTRNKKFDPIVKRAIKAGKPVSAKDAGRMMVGMENKMLIKRGETIARTELLDSLHAAQDEGLQQMLDAGNLQQSQLTYEWDAQNDADTRDSHLVMDGQTRRHGEPFVTGNGHQLMRPGDRSLGAPAEEIIQCRCRKIVKIDFLQDVV